MTEGAQNASGEPFRRRRDDDLTVNEWRILRLEKIADQAVTMPDFDRVRTEVHDLYGKIDSLKTWIVATAIAVCSVILTAIGLLLATRHV